MEQQATPQTVYVWYVWDVVYRTIRKNGEEVPWTFRVLARDITSALDKAKLLDIPESAQCLGGKQEVIGIARKLRIDA